MKVYFLAHKQQVRRINNKAQKLNKDIKLVIEIDFLNK